jgi:hypothetical protein
VANNFVNPLGANEQAAIVAFSSNTGIVQNFTSDKDSLTNAINSLQAGGATALYDAVGRSLELAATANLPRKAVILLTDGRDSGGASGTSREDSLNLGSTAGIPVFTVTLGNDVDQAYMDELARRTYGQPYLAATPDQLSQLYAYIQSLLREQYVLSLDFGSQAVSGRHNLRVLVNLEGTSGAGERAFEAVKPGYSPPKVSLADPLVFGQTINAPLTITPIIDGTEAIASVRYLVDGREFKQTSQPPYEITFDPIEFPPGRHDLRIEAFDSLGASGSFQRPLTVAQIPPRVRIVGPDGDLAEGNDLTFNEGKPLKLEVIVASQSPSRNVALYLDGQLVKELPSAPYVFEVAASDLTNAQRLSIVAVDSSGLQTEWGAELRAQSGGGPLPLLSLQAWAIAGAITLLLAFAASYFFWQQRFKRKGAAVETPVSMATAESDDSAVDSVPQLRGRGAPKQPLARLVLTQGESTKNGKILELFQDPLTLGSAPGCDLLLQGEGVAPRHARIWYREGKFMIHNLSLTADTYIGGKKVDWAVLENGDEIEINSYRLSFETVSLPLRP